MLEYADVRRACTNTHFHCAIPRSHTHLSSTGAQGDVQAESPLCILPLFSPSLSPRCTQNTECGSITEALSLQRHTRTQTEHFLLVIYKKSTDRQTRLPFCLNLQRTLSEIILESSASIMADLKWPPTICPVTNIWEYCKVVLCMLMVQNEKRNPVYLDIYGKR